VDRDPPQVSVKGSTRVVTGNPGELIPVHTQVQASDADPQSTVALVDISGGDGASEVQDAVLEADTRDFKLRAPATGTSRVDRVTYAASDPSGNVALASADVVVSSSPAATLLEAVPATQGTGVKLSVFGQAGRAVTIQAPSDPTGWTDVGRVILVSGQADFIDQTGWTGPYRFYRVVAK